MTDVSVMLNNEENERSYVDGIMRERDAPLPLPRSRPLSEISDNSVKFNRRTSGTIIKSRPNSEVRDEGPKRVSSVGGLEGIKTITLNLSDYGTGSGSTGIKSPTSTVSKDGPVPPSPTTKPGRPILPTRKSTNGKDKVIEEGDAVAG